MKRCLALRRRAGALLTLHTAYIQAVILSGFRRKHDHDHRSDLQSSVGA